MPGRLRLVGLCAVVLFGACAHVHILKVHDDGKVIVGDKAMEPDGLHFYMPRPYVAVHEPFIINATSILVGGQLTPDGQYVLINDVEGTKDAHFHFKLDKEIPASKVFELGGGSTAPNKGAAEGKKLKGAGDKGDSDGSDQKPEEPSGDGTSNTPKEPKGDGDGSGDQPKKDDNKPAEHHGTLNIKAKNDNSAFALTPMKRYFDIVYLPDFDQEYVVQGKAGLGNASIDLSLGQGWSLQGLDASADNSALVGPLLKAIQEASDSLIALGKARLGLPGLATGKGAQGKVLSENKAEFAGGIPLTVKVTFVKVVSPGLYPVLKPKELECLSGCRAAGNTKCLDKADYAADKLPNLRIPTPPLTNIAFDTYELVVVEAAKASGDSITGIGRYFDKGTENPIPGGNKGGDTPAKTLKELLPDVVKAANDDLFQPDGPFWEVTSLEEAKDGLKGKVKANGGKPSKTHAQVVELINAKLKAVNAAAAIKEKDVTFTE